MSKTILHASFIILVLASPCFSIEAHQDPFSKARITLLEDHKGAPGFSIANLAGKKEGLKDYRGKVVFLNFWATWCGPCKEEMPSLEAVYKQFKERKFVLLSISVDYEEKEKVKSFIEKNGYTFPVLLDPELKTYDLYGVKQIPTTFLVDKSGRMVGKATGPRNWGSPEIIAIIESLLK